MKKLLFKKAIPILLLSSFLASCGKEKTRTANEEQKIDPITAVASAADDQKSGGIYKGTLVGSTGAIKIILQGSTKVAYISFNGVPKTLSTTDLNNWSSGQALKDATFVAGDWKIVFSVDASGNNPIVVATIPGHTVSASLVKETSTTTAKTFEGTFNINGQSNVLNFVIKGTELVGLIKSTDQKIFTIRGMVSNNVITASGNSDTGLITATGNLSNDNASGTFNETGTSYNINGTWTAKKTL